MTINELKQQLTEAYTLENLNKISITLINLNMLRKTIDVSDNRIADISQFSGLINLEELNISDNLVENIDAMSNLINLKRAFLSNNQIEDISALLELDLLDYIDLAGNKISIDQINKLLELGIKVDY